MRGEITPPCGTPEFSIFWGEMLLPIIRPPSLDTLTSNYKSKNFKFIFKFSAPLTGGLQIRLTTMVQFKLIIQIKQLAFSELSGQMLENQVIPKS